MKFNKKQKKIMRFGALVLFSVALTLTLKLVFNINFEQKGKYDGKWYLGYKYYEDDTTDNLVFVYVRKLQLFSDNTFYIEDEESYKTNDEIIRGTYAIEDDIIKLNYTVNGSKKEERYYLGDNKLCLDRNCTKYYTKDKLENYIEEHNAIVENKEE